MGVFVMRALLCGIYIWAPVILEIPIQSPRSRFNHDPASLLHLRRELYERRALRFLASNSRPQSSDVARRLHPGDSKSKVRPKPSERATAS